MQSIKSTHSPITEKNRIKEIDIIRGFALFGVLLVNVVYFSQIPFANAVSGLTVMTNPLNINSLVDRIAAIFIQLFAEGKFYTIFSFLYGLGFYIFMKRAEEKGLSPKSLFRKRMFALFVFGLLNLGLVWYGDILHVYGLGGFILIGFRKKSIKSIKRWIVILLCLSTLLAVTAFSASPAALQAHFQNADYFSYNEWVAESFDIYSNGTYIDMVRYRVIYEIMFVAGYLLFIIPKTLAMFLIGVLFGKLNVFEDINKNESLIKKIWKITGVIGGVATLGCVLAGYPLIGNVASLQTSMLFSLFYEIGTVAISLFYITSLTILLKKERVKEMLTPLQYIGRMSLTNYLIQCIACSFVFYGYGLGLIGEMGIFAGMIFTIAFFSFQMVFSTIWFKHFAFGPVEWIWRKFTYFK
ncbi:MAG: DUF418 domain-containing protein [Clostridiaceae bacterium]|nr:DUF418 domain-containing protein [Clostridiaceae bacterium]